MPTYSRTSCWTTAPSTRPSRRPRQSRQPRSADAPATLDGHTPVDADTARTLCAHAPSLRRILTHPESGTVLSVGRTTYQVPADLKALLAERDSTCRFPGCTRPVRRCDLDHTEAWVDGGTTSADNLAALCRHHHVLKHQTRWNVRQLDDGHLRWTSPTGREHRTTPEPPETTRHRISPESSAPQHSPEPAAPDVPEAEPPPF